MENINPINMTETAFNHWNPKVISKVQKKLVKYTVFQGKAVRLPQPEDELFVVLTGQLVLTSNDCFIVLNPGEFGLIAKGIEYRAIALEEVRVMIYTK